MECGRHSSHDCLPLTCRAKGRLGYRPRRGRIRAPPVTAIVTTYIEAVRRHSVRVCGRCWATTVEETLPRPVLLRPLPRSLTPQVLQPMEDKIRVCHPYRCPQLTAGLPQE